eukprot:TRINITY_DN6152_c0_g1_i6.p1 TRINITY_DN6152_c0_g1~~TRINITY_DN6152_c0_g1_i6.p1  ORF type:complete len:281 (+),score=-32.47 TRINITY_DN6152_c0_g1_i6:135-977(+)
MDFINKIKLQKNVRFKYTYTSVYNTIDIRLLSPTSDLRKQLNKIKLQKTFDNLSTHILVHIIPQIQIVTQQPLIPYHTIPIEMQNTSYHIVSYHRYKLQPNNLSYHSIPNHTIVQHIISYRTLSFRIDYTIPYHIIEMTNTSCHIKSYRRYKLQPNNLSYHSIPNHTIVQHIISYRTLSFRIDYTIPYHIIEMTNTSCHIKSYRRYKLQPNDLSYHTILCGDDKYIIPYHIKMINTSYQLKKKTISLHQTCQQQIVKDIINMFNVERWSFFLIGTRYLSF